MFKRTLFSLCSFLLICLFSTFSLAQSRDRTIFLVRHAEKASQEKDALLSKEGHKRAECLAHLLRDAGIKAIFVTQVVRTQQTAEPLAKQLGLTPTVIASSDIDGLVEKLHSASAEVVLVVAHSDTLPGIIEKLGGGTIPAIGNAEYDRLFLVHSPDSKSSAAVTLRYCDCGVN
jgi:broad specificity phosphatase PhoE